MTAGSSSSVSSDSTAQIVTAVSVSSHAPHSKLQQDQSPSTDSLDLNEVYGGITMTTSPSPSPSPPKRALKDLKPAPIATEHKYELGAPLSPIIGSPRSALPLSSPIASSHIASQPTTPMRAMTTPAQPMPVDAASLTRSDTASTHLTSSTTADRMNTIIRREILQGVRAGAAARVAQKAQAPQTPATPSVFFPEQITNYHPPPGAPSSSSPPPAPRVPKKAVESWGMAPSLFEVASVSDDHRPASRHMSANSGRRLSDITAGDAEWKELQKQLKWEQQ